MTNHTESKELTKVEEKGIAIITGTLFDYFQVSNMQLQKVAAAALDASIFYKNLSESIFGPAKAMLKMQEQIASQLSDLCKALASAFDNINIIFQIPRTDVVIREPINIPIYIQPDTPYVAPKKLISRETKKNLPISAIQIVENGFTIEGEYIKGVSLKSKAGKLLMLMIRRDLDGLIPDKLIGEVTGDDPTDYRSWGTVMRDLKVILMGGKLKLDIERQEELKRYELKSLTKYVRKPRKLKKSKNTETMT